MPKALHHSGFICLAELFLEKKTNRTFWYSTETGPNGKKYAQCDVHTYI